MHVKNKLEHCSGCADRIRWTAPWEMVGKNFSVGKARHYWRSHAGEKRSEKISHCYPGNNSREPRVLHREILWEIFYRGSRKVVEEAMRYGWAKAPCRWPALL